LVDATRYKEAWSVFTGAVPAPAITSARAAKLALGLLDNKEQLLTPNDDENKLLARALGLEPGSTEYRLVAQRLEGSEFWSTDLGHRLHGTLEWRGEQREPASAENRKAGDADKVE